VVPAVDDLDTPHVYICGVPEMVVDSRSALEAKGTPSDCIFTEGWEEGAVDE
jgi:NAD(P)H-flavin reductase